MQFVNKNKLALIVFVKLLIFFLLLIVQKIVTSSLLCNLKSSHIVNLIYTCYIVPTAWEDDLKWDMQFYTNKKPFFY